MFVIINHIKLYVANNIVIEKILSKFELLFSVCDYYDYFTKFTLSIHLLRDIFTNCEVGTFPVLKVELLK